MRKRKHISLEQKLAATLACLLPQAERDYVRRTDWSAERIIALFTFDHILLHAWGGGGVDQWQNLDPRRRGPELKAKDAADTRRAAKVRRLEVEWREFMRAITAKQKPTQPKSKWPSRPFPKRRKQDAARN